VPYQDITVDELPALLRERQPRIIDMRDPAARETGMLEGAEPASDALIGSLARQRRNAPPILVYCYHGNTSRDLCTLLATFGVREVYNLVGGWAAWGAKQAGASVTPLPLAPGLGPEHQSWLRARGLDPADLNARVDNGMAALMLAALDGEAEFVDALLAAGADPHAVNDDEHHALWFACVNGDITLVNRLIAAGCRVDNRNVNGVTCTIYAASTGKLDVLRALVEAGADLSIRTHDGYDALDSCTTLPVLRFLKPMLVKAS